MTHGKRQRERNRERRMFTEGGSGGGAIYTATPDLTPRLSWFQKLWKYLATFIHRS